MRLLRDGKSVCLHAPTGGGKTTVAYELFRFAHYLGVGASFYVNRKLLIRQTAARFAAGGLDVGIRAAEFEDEYDPSKAFHICSADTERSRVVNRGLWTFPNSGLIVIDEAHIQKSQVMRQIIDHYQAQGAMIVGLTATPIGMSEWFDELVVSGTLQEYRDCGALVLAKVYSPLGPDLSKIKRNKTGEFVLDGKKKQIYTQSIVGDVIADWKERNPYARPTMLFAPGKPESVWLTEQFSKLGVNWCHVDATDAVVDGKRYRLTRELWSEIQDRYKAGEIKGLSSRFKLREGVDLPTTYHAILATPIGSIASYIQTVGRVLRFSDKTPDEVIVSDHGGNFHRHGSPNDDRPWRDWWHLSEAAASEQHNDGVKDGTKDEPICCPVCHMERASGIVCPGCGAVAEKSKRRIIMHNGLIREVDGKLVRPRITRREIDTQEKWTRLYWSCLKKKGANRTFNQMAAYFQYTHGYQPPRDLDLMPKATVDWYCSVKDVEPWKLRNSKYDRKHEEVPSYE